MSKVTKFSLNFSIFFKLILESKPDVIKINVAESTKSQVCKIHFRLEGKRSELFLFLTREMGKQALSCGVWSDYFFATNCFLQTLTSVYLSVHNE